MKRLTPAPALVRAVVFVSAIVALWAATPATAHSPRLLVPIVVFAAMPAVFPDSAAVTAVMLTVVFGWLAGALVLGESVSVFGTFLTAAALYLLHSFAALAAMLPYDAIVDTGVLLRWAARCGLVLLGSVLVTAIVVTAAPKLAPTTSILALLGGFGVVVGTVWLLSRNARAQKG